MPFLAPLALLLGLLAIPILILYMLRLRRREVIVSSTLLWQKLVRDREANAPWQKLRRNLLLFLQLFILGLLVLALARPYLTVPSLVNRSVVVILDGSASMQATDVAPSRFAAAQAEANRLIAALGSGHRMTIIQAGRTPRVLAAATADRQALTEAIAAAGPGSGTADWGAAFALASGAAQGFQDARVVILSDGGVPEGLPSLPAETVYVPIGRSGENLAIAALATRPVEGGVQLFASVTNEGLEPQEALLSVEVDGRLFDARRVKAPAGETVEFVWSLPETVGRIAARLSDNPGDFLPLDDQAAAVHQGGVTHRVLVVGEGNLFLEQVLGVLPGLQPVKAQPGSDLLDPEADPFDLVVFDGVTLPDPPPAADLLIIDPQPGEGSAPLLDVTGVVTGTQNTSAIRAVSSPILQFVDWNGVNIRQMRQVAATWGEPLVEAAGGPLLITGEQGGRRIAVLTFDLQESDLPLKISFPILMANLVDWLRPGRSFNAPENLAPEDLVTLAPDSSATGVRITRPDGTTWEGAFGEDALLYDETGQLGHYRVEVVDGAGSREAGWFAVNLFAPAESRIQPAADIVVGAIPLQKGTGDEVGQLELWPWLAGLALLVLLIEWWIFHQGTRWPRLPAAVDLERWIPRRR